MDKCLSTKNGGDVAGLKTYCRVYVYRPLKVTDRLLCSGGNIWSPCPDLLTCCMNEPDPSKIYKPTPYWLKRAMEGK